VNNAAPLVTVVTDLARFHRGWRASDVDVVVLPSETATAEFAADGSAPRLLPLGIPVNLRFRPPAPGERDALRRVFGLDERRFTILVSGGGEGSGQLEEQVRALGAEPAGWQLIVVCGRNLRLRKKLLELQLSVPALILGFVDNMPELMRASDLVVSKAGPGAISEALATALPMLLTGYLPGQETGNVAFVTESGAGLYVPSPSRLRESVLSITAEEGRAWHAMSERAAAIARPYAALDIARECVRLSQSADTHGSR
jgi:1,2-diacylglycerol 3-beta-galactosyltransferase